MKLRNAILAGLVLASLTIALTFGSVLPNFPRFVALTGSVVLWYGYAAIRWTNPDTLEDAAILRSGLKWGLAIAGAFVVTSLVPFAPATFIFPALALLLLIPTAAGGSGAIRSGRTFSGARVGFWSGLIGGMLGFFVLAFSGYVQALLSGVGVFSFMEANEYGSLRLAAFALVFYGPVFSPVAAMVGGWVGIRLAKTGEVSPVSSLSGRHPISQ